MFSKSYSATLEGIHARIVQVEADVNNGLPCFELVGLLGTEVREAKERVRVALFNSNYFLPPKRITVNLAPADIRKEGTAFDLAIAISVLTASGHIPQDVLENIIFIGELSLDGRIQKVNGILPIVAAAKEQGFLRCVVPSTNAREGAIIQGIDVIGANTLSEVVLYLLGGKEIPETFVNVQELVQKERDEIEHLDFSEIIGQTYAKRAIEIAVAGHHNILMIGPPGSGKTMLAKCIPTIMPDLSFEESILLTKIYSVAGELKEHQSLVVNRPFRAPHHTITISALIGGGRRPKPGEISIATHGVLFLDELPEFPKGTLELLRQPLEDRSITISRLNQIVTYPANCMVVAAMNPCSCGYYPNPQRCNCSINQVKRYLNRISGPLLDRIDLMIETSSIAFSDMSQKAMAESSKNIRERIMKAREIQYKRYENQPYFSNSELTPKAIRQFCKLENQEETYIQDVFSKLDLSTRSYHRILKVARTIADLDNSEVIKKKHISEAVCYRCLDKKYWGG